MLSECTFKFMALAHLPACDPIRTGIEGVLCSCHVCDRLMSEFLQSRPVSSTQPIIHSRPVVTQDTGHVGRKLCSGHDSNPILHHRNGHLSSIGIFLKPRSLLPSLKAHASMLTSLGLTNTEFLTGERVIGRAS